MTTGVGRYLRTERCFAVCGGVNRDKRADE
jgi:hypothetical protein